MSQVRVLPGVPSISIMDIKFLKLAIEKSKESIKDGGFPVGVVLVVGDKVLVDATSNGKQLNDPTSHAEIAAIRDACSKLKTRSLNNVTLFSSMEPCIMCFGACVWASIPKVVYACGRKQLSKMHFEGTHVLSEINESTNKPLQLVHIEELEEQALEVVQDWESSLK